MKKSLYSLLLYILIFAFSMSFFDGISLPSDLSYWLLLAVIFAVSVMLHRPLLRFLTVKVNFITFWLAAGLLTVGAAYLTELLVPGFIVTNSVFEGATLGTVIIGAFELSKIFTMIVASFLYAGICALMDSLNKGNE